MGSVFILENYDKLSRSLMLIVIKAIYSLSIKNLKNLRLITQQIHRFTREEDLALESVIPMTHDNVSACRGMKREETEISAYRYEPGQI